MSGDNVMAVAARAKAIFEAYLKEMGVPQKYFDEMFAVPKGRIKWISKHEFKADFEGFIPELADWVAARCDKLTKDEKASWEIMKDKNDAESQEVGISREAGIDILKKLEEQDKCEREEQKILAAQALFKAFDANKLKPNAPAK